MWWRGAIIGTILGLWIALGVAWGWNAALVYGFSLLIACLFALGAVLGGGVTKEIGAWYFDRQLRGHHRR